MVWPRSTRHPTHQRRQPDTPHKCPAANQKLHQRPLVASVSCLSRNKVCTAIQTATTVTHPWLGWTITQCSHLGATLPLTHQGMSQLEAAPVWAGTLTNWLASFTGNFIHRMFGVHVKLYNKLYIKVIFICDWIRYKNDDQAGLSCAMMPKWKWFKTKRYIRGPSSLVVIQLQ